MGMLGDDVGRLKWLALSQTEEATHIGQLVALGHTAPIGISLGCEQLTTTGRTSQYGREHMDASLSAVGGISTN